MQESIATITSLHVAPAKVKRVKATPKPTTKPAIRKNAGVVEQVRIALSAEHRLATFIGALLGALVPFTTYAIAHLELAREFWYDPRSLLVAGGLIFSARTVYQWGRLALGSPLKAAGFTVLLEGAMVGSSQPWLAIVALVYLCLINAIATGVTLARGLPSAPASTDGAL